MYFHKQLSTLLSIFTREFAQSEILMRYEASCCHQFVSERDFGRDAYKEFAKQKGL